MTYPTAAPELRPRPSRHLRFAPFLVAAVSCTLLTLATAHAQDAPPAVALRPVPPPGQVASTAGNWQMPPARPPGSPEPTRTANPPAPPTAPAPATFSPHAGMAPLPASAVQEPDQVEEEDTDEPSPPFFDLIASTHLPLSVGGGASLELPGRLLIQLEAGWMPPAYGSVINSLVQEFGAYDSNVGALVDGALGEAVVVRVSAGWRPFPEEGFEITGGYTYVGLSGELSSEALWNVVGGELPAELSEIGQLPTDPVELSSQLHSFHVALGWRWVVAEHFLIRATLGYTQTVGASSSVDVPGQAEITSLANPVVDQKLEELYQDYVKLPSVGLSAGYRF